MRIIRIIADGVPIEVVDKIDEDIETATKKLVALIDGEKIISLIGKNSSAIIRPSSISGINIIDREDLSREATEFQKKGNSYQENANKILTWSVTLRKENLNDSRDN